MVPIIAAITWDRNWKGGKVVALCDNIAVVAALNNKSCKEKFVMQVLQTLFFIEAHFQFKLVSKHISGSRLSI